MRGRATLAACLVTALGLLAGCATGTDDELQPRPTPTVTVTGEPVQELPARLDLSGDVDLADEVVWASGTLLHVGGREIDLAALVPDQLVVLPTGVLVRTGDEVWFTAGRRADGLPLPPVRTLGLSADGSQVVLRVGDRDEPVAYDLDGALVDDADVQRLRSPERTRSGPEDAAASVPDDLAVRGWLSRTTAYGVRGREVAVCDLQPDAACEVLGRVPRGADPAGLVFGSHPAG